MRAVLLVAVVCVVAVAGVAVGRPVLHNKLAHRRARLGEGVAAAAVAQASKAEVAELERLRVAASEREGLSLADQFATDLEAHVVAKDALKAAAKQDVEATAGLDVAAAVEVGAEADTEAEAEADTEAEVDIDVAQAADAVAEEAGAVDAGLSFEALQELEFSNPKKNAPKAKAGVKPSTLQADGTKWANCLAAPAKGAKGAGQTKLTSVVLRAAPPMREQSFVVEIDGTYAGADVTYGSVTLQIARVATTEPQAKGLPELVYRHSVVLKDVLMYNPFTAKNPLSATMYVPESAFNAYAPAGDYTMSVVFTNQDKQPFACTKVDFKLA